MERYQSVAKFAADVAAITGRPTTGAVPHTRSRGDTDAKTQLLTPISAASSPRKKRSLIPVVAGVVVILAGGGAWVALNGGNKGKPSSVDSTRNVARDTVKNSSTRQNDGVRPVGTQSITLANRDTGQRTRPPTAAPRVDPAQAGSLLEDLFNKLDAKAIPAATVRDSARHIFETRGITTADSAFAAYIEANAFATLDDERPRSGHKATALQWAERAARLQPASRAYRQLAQDLAKP
jgi:hypothetical protein